MSIAIDIFVKKCYTLIMEVVKIDINSVAQFIGSLGFPIVACIGMYYRMIKQDEMHKEEMNKVTEAINNNSKAIELLTLRLGGTDAIRN